MARILIIEDEESIRKLLNYDLVRLGHEVELATNGQEGLDKALGGKYDIILIDWMLPILSGIQLVNKFRERELPSILIMLTAKDAETDILEAFEAGVDDYITKPFSPRELSARISAHLRRYQNDAQPKNTKVNDLEIDYQMYSVFVKGELVPVTKKEFELLVYLVNNKDIVLSRDNILNKIWNFDYDGDTRIVDVHVFKLRTKLEDSNVSIQSVRGVGYVFKAN